MWNYRLQPLDIYMSNNIKFGRKRRYSHRWKTSSMQEIGLVSRRKLRRMRPLIASNVMFNSMWETREYILQHVYIYMAILGCFNAVSTTIFSPEKQSNLIIVTSRSKGLALKLFRLLLGYSRTIFFFFLRGKNVKCIKLTRLNHPVKQS